MCVSPVYIAGDGLDQRSDAGLLAVLGGHQLGPQAALQPPVVLHLKNFNFTFTQMDISDSYQKLILEDDIQGTLELLM